MTDTDQMNCALSQARPEILCVPLDTDLHRCPLFRRNSEVLKFLGPRCSLSALAIWQHLSRRTGARASPQSAFLPETQFFLQFSGQFTKSPVCVNSPRRP